MKKIKFFRTKPTLNYPSFLKYIFFGIGFISFLGAAIFASFPLFLGKAGDSNVVIDVPVIDEDGNFVLPIQEKYVYLKIKRSHCYANNLVSGSLTLFEKDVQKSTYSCESFSSKFENFLSVKITTSSYTEGFNLYKENAKGKLFYISKDAVEAKNYVTDIKELVRNNVSEQIVPNAIDSDTVLLGEKEKYIFVLKNTSDIEYEKISQYLYFTSEKENFYLYTNENLPQDKQDIIGKSKMSEISVQSDSFPLLIKSENGKYTYFYSKQQEIIKFLEILYRG